MNFKYNVLWLDDEPIKALEIIRQQQIQVFHLNKLTMLMYAKESWCRSQKGIMPLFLMLMV